MFRSLFPADDAPRRAAVPIEAWSDFAAAEIRALPKAPDRQAVERDNEFLDTCLRVLGVAGAATTEQDVAALEASLSGLGDAGYRVECIREEASCAAARLRIRHHWDREAVTRLLRAAPEGTWANEDQAKWLRRTFREKDPAGWAAFLLEEATRPDAHPHGVAAAAAGMKDLPAADAVPVLRRLLAHDDEYVRLETSLALHSFDARDEASKAVVVKLALDRSILCECRDDLTNRWSRTRALVAALDWGGLSAEKLRAHVVAPKPDVPEFLSMACAHLAKTPQALTDSEIRDAWRRLLESPIPDHLLAAVEFLEGVKDAASKDRMLAALARLDVHIAGLDEDDILHNLNLNAGEVARLRERVHRLGVPDDGK